jgi:ABC-type transport system involved in multi-copper enzyme maturation permease subunit
MSTAPQPSASLQAKPIGQTPDGGEPGPALATALLTSPLRHALNGIGAVIQYEFQRSLTTWRIGLWIAMILFPVALIGTVSYLVLVRGEISQTAEFRVAFVLVLFVLLPEVVTVLGMLLWATPIVNSELEGQTWIYSLVRPGGRRSILLGKYVVAVLWTASCGSIAATLTIPLIGIDQPLKTWGILVGLCWLSSIAHGALFATLGVLFQRRIMVLAFVYAIAIEAALGWIPAVINKFTIAYRLRSILFQWLDLPMTDRVLSSQLVSDGTPTWIHLACLIIGSAVLLGFACWRIGFAQYSWQSEV